MRSKSAQGGRKKKSTKMLRQRSGPKIKVQGKETTKSMNNLKDGIKTLAKSVQKIKVPSQHDIDVTESSVVQKTRNVDYST